MAKSFCSGCKHWKVVKTFDNVEEDLPQIHFREATETERNIANATAIDMDEFMDGVHFF